MPAIYKREAEKVPEEPQPEPVEEMVESTLKTFVSTEEIKEGKSFFALSLNMKIASHFPRCNN